MFWHSFSILRAKNLVNRDDVFRALEAENHDIYSAFASGRKSHGIYNVFGFGPSQNTGIYAVFSMLQDVVSISGKRKNIVCYDVCFLGTEKNVKKLLQNGQFGSKSGQLNPA